MTTRSERGDPRVLLVSPPWRKPHVSGLALSTLKPILARQGIRADVLHASLLHPVSAIDTDLLDNYASFLIAPYVYPSLDRGTAVERIVELYVRTLSYDGLLDPRTDIVMAQARTVAESERLLAAHLAVLRAQLHESAELVATCLDRTFERMTRRRYDVVGFSMTFEAQVPAALALSRRLKAHDAGARIMFGGNAVWGEQADGFASSFPEVDAVCHSEGETVIGPLVRALRGELPLERVPGISYLHAAGHLRRTAGPPLLRDLDTLPIPDHDDFFEQLAASEWREHDARLMFETSRGCWWGEKSLCTFCGVNGEGLAFRRKSGERAFEELSTLHRRYPKATWLQGADNILDMRYFRSLLPRLAAREPTPEHPLRVFYEVKSNLTREQVQLLAEAGVIAVQPGIESFSDEVLSAVKKGVSGIQQIQFVKWSHEADIHLNYNVLVLIPGEQVGWLRELLGVIPYLSHLPPPQGIFPILLERYSPMYQRPEEFGIGNLRPSDYYRGLFPDDTVDLERVAYNFDFDSPRLEDPEYRAHAREVVLALRDWARRWRRNLAWCTPGPDGSLVLVDRRSGKEERRVVAGAAAELLDRFHRVRGLAAAVRAGPALEPAVLEAALDTWLAHRWVYRDRRDRCLVVLPLAPRKRRPEARPAAAP